MEPEPPGAVAKAEWLPGAGGGNPRFVVTSLDRQTIAKQALYEEPVLRPW